MITDEASLKKHNELEKRAMHEGIPSFCPICLAYTTDYKTVKLRWGIALGGCHRCANRQGENLAAFLRCDDIGNVVAPKVVNEFAMKQRLFGI